MWDSLGFGFSDKPAGDDKFSYALLEQAEYAVELWRRLGIEHVRACAPPYSLFIAFATKPVTCLYVGCHGRLTSLPMTWVTRL